MKKVLFCSLLKPADDVRMYQKLAISFPDMEDRAFVFVGRDRKGEWPKENNTRFLPVFDGRSSLYYRLNAILKLWKILVKEKPHTIINTSPDFLIVTAIYKIIFGYKLVNDVQENHELNIKTQGYHHGWKKWLLIIALRISYHLAKSQTDLWILAENIYVKQLPWIANLPYQVFENKFVKPKDCTLEVSKASIQLPIDLTKGKWRFVLSGTFSKLYATIDALSFILQLREANDRIELTLIGYCPDARYWEEIQSFLNHNKKSFDDDWFHVIGGKAPVPYPRIIEVLNTADIGIAAYQLHPSFEGKTPTKYFECAAINIPILALNPNQFSINFANTVQCFSNNWNLLVFSAPNLAIWDYRLAIN